MDKFGAANYAVRERRYVRSGTYFAEPGGSLGPVPKTRARKFRYPAAKIADFEDPGVLDAILQEALAQGGAFGQRYGCGRLRFLKWLLDISAGVRRKGLNFGWMPRWIFELLGLAEHAARLGYDGARVRAKNDILKATSVCIWNMELVEPVTGKI